MFVVNFATSAIDIAGVSTDTWVISIIGRLSDKTIIVVYNCVIMLMAVYNVAFVWNWVREGT